MRLSIVDLAQITAGTTAVAALDSTVRLAQLADRLGYSRYWLAEHHGSARMVASSSPEIMIARVAAATTTIRVGSGTVLLNQHSAFRVAESFRLLHALFPGRIDLGLGRASAGAALDLALRRDRTGESHNDYDEQVVEVLTWYDNAFPEGHSFAGISLYPGVSGNPEPWLLGSSPNSAVLAGLLGLPYCFAGFLNPGAVRAALETYRREFRPSTFGTGSAEPHTMVALNVCCAPTESAAARIRASIELTFVSSRGGGVVLADDAVAALGGLPEPTRYRRGEWPRSISAAPDRLRETLEAMAAEVGADELMLQDLIADPADRRLSYELIARAFELSGPGERATRVVVNAGAVR